MLRRWRGAWPRRELQAVGRRFDPPWPQGNQGVRWFQWIEQPGVRPRWLRARRGQFFPPPAAQAPAAPPSWVPGFIEQSGSRPRWAARPRKGRRFDPPWAQGPQTVWRPGQVVARRRAPAILARRGTFAEPPWPAIVITTSPPRWVEGASAGVGLIDASGAGTSLEDSTGSGVLVLDRDGGGSSLEDGTGSGTGIIEGSGGI